MTRNETRHLSRPPADDELSTDKLRRYNTLARTKLSRRARVFSLCSQGTSKPQSNREQKLAPNINTYFLSHIHKFQTSESHEFLLISQIKAKPFCFGCHTIINECNPYPTRSKPTLTTRNPTAHQHQPMLSSIPILPPYIAV